MRGLFGALVVAISVSSSTSCYIPADPNPQHQLVNGGAAPGQESSTQTSVSSSQPTPSGSSNKGVVNAASVAASSVASSSSMGEIASATSSASMADESTAVTSVLNSAASYPDTSPDGPKLVTASNGAVIINTDVTDDAGPNIPPGFISFSLDDEALVAYLGEPGKPNTLSVNLLQNLGDRMGAMPSWRIWGDNFVFDPTQSEAVIQGKAPGGKGPVMGPTWFESFANVPNTQYIMGLNFAWTGDAAAQNRLDTITAVCQKLKPNMISYWEMGNEPDLYSANGDRSSSYTVEDHAKEYVDATNAARAHMATACPGFPNTFMGTSIIGDVGSAFDPLKSFNLGINDKNPIDLIGTHSYVAFEGTAKATLANLMSHKTISNVITYHSQIGVNCAKNNIKIPYILGETNSIAGGGAKGISDVFGAALYAVDFSLRGAASGILRTHTHHGSGTSYNDWEPGWGEANHPTYVGAPYYGHILVAEALGGNNPRVVEVGLPGNFNDAAYAIYENEKIARIAVVNFDGASHPYKFQVGNAGQVLKVSILDAPDKSSQTGITYDGFSYTVESNGKPVLSNPAGSTTVTVDSAGDISLTVKGVQAVLIHVI